jgi:hypothetical protein
LRPQQSFVEAGIHTCKAVLIPFVTSVELAVLCLDVLATILVATLAPHTNPLAWDTVNLSNQLVRTSHSFLNSFVTAKSLFLFFIYISMD